MAEQSWHVPYIFKYNSPDPLEALHVVFLQRMTDIEQEQVLQGLREIDTDFLQRLDIAQLPAPRRLTVKKWIRDRFPSSATILKIAEAAYSKGRDDSDHSYSSIIFVDSGWDLGNVVAAHWEQNAEGERHKLSAARVPVGVANVLLTTCDRVEGMTLDHALGHEAYDKARVDFYKDSQGNKRPTTLSEIGSFEWPSHLPKDMTLQTSCPTIISLRHLDDSTISSLKEEILQGAEGASQKIDIYNWEGPEPTNRLLIRDMFKHLRDSRPEPDKEIYAFFIDYMLQGPFGKPQILAVSYLDRGECEGVRVLPVFTPKFLSAWEEATKRQAMDETQDIVDIWKREHVYHLNAASSACPIFFLQPFSQDEERRIRAAICALGDVEDGEDWGHQFNWQGYIFNDEGKEHTLEDLRDLFESSDPFSPFFDEKKAGPYRLACYPSNFVAVDDKILDPEQPKVWMASSLDFHGEDTSDQLGWTYGQLDAKETSIIFVNLDIANQGPDECLDEETIDQLWLSDLKAYREEDWKAESGR